MSGPASYARHADAASVARDRLDAAAEAAATVEAAQRGLLAALLELWPTSAWLAAGATSAKQWLLAYTHCSEPEAHRLERAAGLCHRHPSLAEAVLSGELPLAKVDVLGRAATPEREPWLADSLDALLRLNRHGRAEDWGTAVRFWAERVDEERAVRQIPRHSLSLTQRLFGGGEVHADLSPSAFLNVAAALDAWTDDPDPKAAPYQRSLGERRADALDDLCAASLRSFEDTAGTDPGDDADGDGDGDGDGYDDPADDVPADDVPADDVPADDVPADDVPADDVPADGAWADDPAGGEPAGGQPADTDPPRRPTADDPAADDTFDGWAPTDDLDEALAERDDGGDGGGGGGGLDLTDPLQRLEVIRRRLRRAELCRRRRARRRTRARSDVRVNVHIDLRTLAGLRDIDDLDDLVLRGDGWRLTKEAAERLLCDTAMVAVLFDGKGHILDANDDAETWTPRQRRAIAARDRHCVFPSCTRPPRHCDIHHLHHRAHGGPTKTANGALLCRFHHRLLHEYGWTLSVIHGRWVAQDPHGNTWTGRPRAPDPATTKTAT